MKLRIGRILIAAPIATVSAAVLITISSAVVFVVFVTTATMPYVFAEVQRSTLWAAPLAGFVTCLFGGRWIAQGMQDGGEANGLAFGIVVALLDLILLYSSGAPFGLLMVGSAASRATGGYVGGCWAGRGSIRLARATTPCDGRRL